MKPSARLVLFLLSIALLHLATTSRGYAEPIDLTFRHTSNDETWLRPSVVAKTAWFAQNNAWAGNDEQFLGGDSAGWAEFGLEPGLEAQVSLGGAGTLHAKASAVYTTTQFGLDAAGSNFSPRHPDKLTLEEAHVGWSSGKLFPNLGVDAIDLSVGAQPYHLGTGFLFNYGGRDGGKRGAYWLAMRDAFELTGIARLTTGPFQAEAMYLRPNDDDPNTSTDLVGINMEYEFGDRAKAGVGYWRIIDSQIDRRDGLNVWNLRLEGQPLKSLPGLMLKGELVKQKNGKRNDSWGGYIESSYQFDKERYGEPLLTYRFIAFSGDDGSGTNKAFDPLFYGMTDWGTWFIGEIAGEYVIGNQNLDIHLIRLQARPFKSVSTSLIYYYFRLRERNDEIQPRPPTSPRQSLIRDKDLAHELDFIVDWSPRSNFSLSAVIATLFPVAGGEDFFESNDPWTSFMLSTSLKF